MTRTNLKNLPEGPTYFTEIGYSQSYPWVEVSRTEKTVKLAKVLVGPDPDWKPKMHAGGFSAHCSNQNEQTWIYAGVDKEYTKIIRKTKMGWSHSGVKFRENEAVEFYDYNF